jgi:bifunctional DNA-binding transcriptional regulator/antitoxin component of YhaV-PrlF toxin-antitoxin module
METDVKAYLTVVTRKGQITVPVEVCRALGLPRLASFDAEFDRLPGISRFVP